MPEIDKNNPNLDFLEIDDYPKNDHLKLVRFFCYDIFEITLVKMSVVATVYVSLLITLAQTYLFLQNFNLKYFIQYVPMYFVLQFVTVSCCGVLSLSKEMSSMLKELRMFVPKDKNHEIFKKMKKEAKIINFVVTALLVSGMISGFLILVPTEKDEDLYFIYDLIRDYTLPAWKTPLSFLFSISVAFYAFVVLANLTQFIYGAYHIKYQIEITTVNCIQRIHDLCESRDCNCGQHQEQIKEILKFVILSQCRLTNYGTNVVKKLWPVIASYSLFGGLFFISMLFLMLTVEHTFISYAKIIPIYITGTLTGISVIMLGQNIEDSSVKAFNDLCTLKWYNWNKENKKIYLIMLSNQMVPFKIKFSENIAVNYKLGFKICRTVYSVVSVLIQMRNAKF
ncbi:hypothetical protein Zmor_016030 [Zophobas morio]|uniref:Odorant receptor n=1 Tax=Zophobas morio TaxID=2755281 RepID=A0AA38MI72_9CUCU|nr:hypothetical protein Zmor_016030 [Zophobas morio]